jgi:glycosyltransferase involved in cell wall biosynthesis
LTGARADGGTTRVAICGAQTLFAKGGAELHIEALARELGLRGYQVDIVKLPLTWSKADLLQDALAWRMINVDADILIATNFPSYFAKHPNKIIWLFHQHRQLYELYGTPWSAFGRDPEDAEIRRIVSGADSRFILEARRIFTTSRNVAERLRRFNGIWGQPLYHPPPLYRSLRCGDYGDFILMPTRFQPNKRPELLLEALRWSRSSIKAVVVGGGPLEGELRRRTEKYGLDDRVRFAGVVDDAALVDLYARCGAVFYAPYDEDYGYVTLEAFYAKKPVITTSDSGGILEFVVDGETGRVTSPDPEAIAPAIDQLARSRDLCRHLGAAGYERVAALSWDDVIAKLVGDIA